MNIDERTDLSAQKIDKETQTTSEIQTVQLLVERASKFQQ